MHRTADCVDSHERSKEIEWASRGAKIVFFKRGALDCPFGEMLRLIARVISFSSLLYLASAKICSHTYNQLLVLLLLLLTKPNRRSTSDNNHSYILCTGVFMHFGSVGSLWLPLSLCALPAPRKPDCPFTLSNLKPSSHVSCDFLMNDFHAKRKQTQLDRGKYH